jgi:hypothetical protein
MTVDFEAMWCGTNLGDYRPCSSTYERYPYSSIPILDASRFTGSFEWIVAHGTIDAAKVASMEALSRQLAAVGLTLPRDFVRYHTHVDLSRTLEAVSGTGCWSTVPEQPIPSPVEPGALLVRFLNDQQDCVTWYLYLRPSGEVFVAHAYGLEFEVDDEGTPAYLRPGTFPTYLDARDYEAFAKIYWCAPSFEQFAYRFWIENRILGALVDDPKATLAADLEGYLDHYRRVHEAP